MLLLLLRLLLLLLLLLPLLWTAASSFSCAAMDKCKEAALRAVTAPARVVPTEPAHLVCFYFREISHSFPSCSMFKGQLSADSFCAQSRPRSWLCLYNECTVQAAAHYIASSIRYLSTHCALTSTQLKVYTSNGAQIPSINPSNLLNQYSMFDNACVLASRASRFA
ncbi:uncharacterized protein V2V93DRAFT_358911 [Kockiozyma suomiensis]|uniref:uncharacterized protein n=1 Tax=Kockiozyma suomiensis TaxID=1337062 RepID=UPI0033439764